MLPIDVVEFIVVLMLSMLITDSSDSKAFTVACLLSRVTFIDNILRWSAHDVTNFPSL